MMRAYLDRMFRPRDITMRFHEIKDPVKGGPSGILTTSEALSQRDINLIKSSLRNRQFADGEVVKVVR
jgi:hypothetical protein